MDLAKIASCRVSSDGHAVFEITASYAILTLIQLYNWLQIYHWALFLSLLHIDGLMIGTDTSHPIIIQGRIQEQFRGGALTIM